MLISRRRFLLFSVALGLFARLLPARARQQTSAQPSSETLRAYLDTLIPADETPSASQLGTDRWMLAKGRKDEGYQLALVVGTTWLDEQARERGTRDFVSLDLSAREAVVTRAAGADSESVENLFFEITRTDAMQHYYAQPESWRGIPGYQGPPQPLGYMDYYLPPQK
jgi:hypothetical protein